MIFPFHLATSLSYIWWGFFKSSFWNFIKLKDKTDQESKSPLSILHELCKEYPVHNNTRWYFWIFFFSCSTFHIRIWGCGCEPLFSEMTWHQSCLSESQALGGFWPLLWLLRTQQQGLKSFWPTGRKKHHKTYKSDLQDQWDASVFITSVAQQWHSRKDGWLVVFFKQAEYY